MDEHLRSERTSLFRDLREAGYEIHSVNDLLTAKEIPPEAVRVMLRYLLAVTDPDLKDAIVRGLTAREVRRVPEAAPVLVELFRRPNSSQSLRWVIGNALSVIADERVVDDLIEIVRDRQYRASRQMVAEALGRVRNSRVISILIMGLEDEDIAGHCVVALGKLRALEAVPHLQKMLSHPKAWVRAEAKRALNRIQPGDPKARSPEAAE